MTNPAIEAGKAWLDAYDNHEPTLGVLPASDVIRRLVADMEAERGENNRLRGEVEKLREVLEEMFCEGPVGIAFAGNPIACAALEAKVRAALAKGDA